VAGFSTILETQEGTPEQVEGFPVLAGRETSQSVEMLLSSTCGQILVGLVCIQIASHCIQVLETKRSKHQDLGVRKDTERGVGSH
jgi:hypothetical protein